MSFTLFLAIGILCLVEFSDINFCNNLGATSTGDLLLESGEIHGKLHISNYREKFCELLLETANNMSLEYQISEA